MMPVNKGFCLKYENYYISLRRACDCGPLLAGRLHNQHEKAPEFSTGLNSYFKGFLRRNDRRVLMAIHMKQHARIGQKVAHGLYPYNLPVHAKNPAESSGAKNQKLFVSCHTLLTGIYALEDPTLRKVQLP